MSASDGGYSATGIGRAESSGAGCGSNVDELLSQVPPFGVNGQLHRKIGLGQTFHRIVVNVFIAEQPGREHDGEKRRVAVSF